MELLVYKASAGSGKTFTLAVEYIKRLLIDPHAYRHILAVTFTNKATTEMKSRILEQLYGIATAHPSSAPYLSSIRQKLPATHTSLSEADLRLRAAKALQYILHDYGRFRVETIDSFFQSVMRGLARELELSPNLNIELSNDEVLTDAVSALLEGLTPHSPVLGWLLDYIDEKIGADKRWHVADEIRAFGRNIFDEQYIEYGEPVRLKLKSIESVRLYRDVLRDMLTEALDQMKSFSDQFEAELEGHGFTTDDLKSKSKGIASYFNKLAAGKLSDKDVLTATLAAHLESAENWASKTSSTRQGVIRLAEDHLLNLLREAEQMRPERNRTVNSVKLSLAHLNKLLLLNHIDQEVRTLNQKHNRFLLSDTNALLHRLVRDGDSSFVFEKLGANIRSVMIDEFQDTSRMQWGNFRLLLLEGLAGGSDSLIVGDVKQSIYRWRSGDWTLLNRLRDTAGQALIGTPIPFPIRVETLNTNRRSQPSIIRFNNLLFEQAVSYLNRKHLAELGEECLPLKSAYADVAQKSPHEADSGYIKVSMLERGDEADYRQRTLSSLSEQVNTLIAQGVQPDHIAILVRKNKNIPLIADHLTRTSGLPVVSDEAFRLDASEALCLLIDALRYLTDGADGVARASLIMTYQQHLRGSLPLDIDRLVQLSDPEVLPASFCSRREELRLLPLYELLEELFVVFDLAHFPRQNAYYFYFFDVVTEYLQNNPSHIDAFVTHWDEVLSSKTIPGGELHGIRILSIHKSKGLQYHTILIPFCDWKLENETNNQLVWCHPGVPPYDALDLLPINYSASMAESIYRADYLRERLQLWVDNLNLLYVALTRAEHNLIVWSKDGQKGTMAELLGVVLPQIDAQGLGGWNDTTLTFEHGTIVPSAASARHQTDANKLTAPSAPLPVEMQSGLHHVEFRQSNQSADFIAGTDAAESGSRFIDRGRLLHKLFAQIRTEADIDPAIRSMVAEGVISGRAEEQDIRSLMAESFQSAQVKAWYDGSWRIYSECEIIRQEADGMHSKRPDRVMERNGRWVIVDFKFGSPRPQYREQVQSYMHLLADMGKPMENIEGYLWYVDLHRVDEVRV